MPTLTTADGSVYVAPAGAAASPSAPAIPTGAASASQVNTNAAEKPPAINDPAPSSRPLLPPSNESASPPLPPPGAPEIQLKMWHAVLLRRKHQMLQLSQTDLLSFANEISSDLLSTRYETNEYSSETTGANKENNLQESSSAGDNKIDMTAGHYSTFLLREEPVPANISAERVGLHFLALFYRAMDDRLPNCMRKHGIDAIRRACQKLDSCLPKKDAGKNKKSNDNNVEAAEGSERGSRMGRKKRKIADGAQKVRENDTQKNPKENASQRPTDSKDGSKKMRKSPPESNGDLATTVPGAAQKPGKALHSHPPQVCDEKDGGKPKAKRNDTRSEVRPPPPTQKQLNRNQSEGEKARERSLHKSASSGKTITNHSASSQQGIAAAQKKPLVKPPHKQSDAGISSTFGDRENVGQRFPPAQHKHGQKEPSQDNGNARGPSPKNSAPPKEKTNNAPSSQQAPATMTNSRPQRKDPSESNHNISERRPQTAVLPSKPQRGQSGNVPRSEKSKHQSSEVSASHDNNPQKQTDASTSRKKPSSANLHQENATNQSNLAEDRIASRGAHKANKPDTAATSTSNTAKKSIDPASGTPPPAAVANKKVDRNIRHITKRPPTPPRPSPESQRVRPPAPTVNNTVTNDSFDDDIIDLTEDSPPQSPRHPPKDPPPPAAKAASTSTRAIKQCDEERTASTRAPQRPPSPPKRVLPPRPPSPPASPVPFATIHNPLPPPQARPKPFLRMQSLIFNADKVPCPSGSLIGRNSCVVSYDSGFHLDGSGSCLDDALCNTVSNRLATWDPYWKIVEELGARNVVAAPFQNSSGMMATRTRVGTRTTPCMPAQRTEPISPQEYPKSCASVLVDFPRVVNRSKLSKWDGSGKSLPEGYRPWGVRWGSYAHPYTDEKKKRQRDRLETGDRRLIVRTLPLERTSKDIKKRADGHLWPKGTFVQLSRGGSEHVLAISQRKQQSHDHSEWKGMSLPLDLSFEVKNTNIPIELKLCSKEVPENSSSNDAKATLMGSYAVHVAICEYVAPDDLYKQLMGKGGEVTIPRISLRSGRKMAKEYLKGQMVSIDDSDDEEDNSKDNQGQIHEDAKSLTFSLLCPISKTTMQTPVRGRNCKHMQCMDLRNFLHANKNVTGGRWRCGACESFVNVRDLVHCGLFQAMIDSLGSQISGARDRVSFQSDGSWKLMDENRLRYSNKGRSRVLSTGGKVEANDTNAGGKRPSSEPEVIELL